MNAMAISGNNSPFYGNISYKKNPAIPSNDKTLTLERFIVENSKNAQELSQNFDFTAAGKKIISYNIILGKDSVEQPLVTLVI